MVTFVNAVFFALQIQLVASLSVWYSVSLSVCQYSSLIVWRSHSSAICQSFSLAVWQSFSPSVWQCGSLAIWQSGSLAVQQTVSLAVLQSGSTTVHQWRPGVNVSATFSQASQRGVNMLVHPSITLQCVLANGRKTLRNKKQERPLVFFHKKMF